uniref:Putative LOC100368669 [Saccoglossus kowalevskii] n=1 Tax=Lepeophtheirus salmonis TaxID=72036 RepID=A0A0K2TMM7_LEPSM
MYTKKKRTSGNEVRLQLFLNKHTPKKAEERTTCLQKLDDSYLQPCSRLLLQKIRWTHLVARRWLTATRSTQAELFPKEYGWKNVNGCYQLRGSYIG